MTATSVFPGARYLLIAAGVSAVVLALRPFQLAVAGAPAAVTATAAPARHVARVAAEGRIAAYPGADVTLGTDVAGTVMRLLVAEKSKVEKGQLLAELRADDLQAERAAAEARTAAAAADLRLAEIERERAAALWQAEVGPRIDLERRNQEVRAIQSRLEAAGAAARALQARLQKYRILAPIAGVVTSRWVEPGETVDVGARLLTIADLDRLRVEAEVDEYDAGRIAVGAPVAVKAEGFDGSTFRGEVEEIPDRVVPRQVRSADPARPVDARVLLVKVKLLEPVPMKLGQRVEVEIGDGR